ncbi:MAG: M48 family metallopeptidase [Pirellulaceae bacterium]|nr:M48 family metallopeptidase [Planctomycetales bacterium]
MARRGFFLLLVTVLLAGTETGCRTAPITGRKQLLLVPEAQEIEMGLSAFSDAIGDDPVSSNVQYQQLIQRVGSRIAAVANRPDYQWEFKVIASPEQNAFCLPGGKVAVYEGIIPICQNEAGLAVVMSHEVAHALARHGGERMSQGYVVNGASQALSFVLRKQEETRRQQIMSAYGVASKYGFLLPYSRKHESEADHMGLIMMAQAGYDPAEAPRFWERFAASHAGSEKPPEFLSTHPADERRADDLRRLLPDAEIAYQNSANKFGLGESIVR